VTALFSDASAAAPPLLPGLRGRDLDVLPLVAGGLTDADAGRALGVSGRTVRASLDRLGAVLGTRDRAGIVGRRTARGCWRARIPRRTGAAW